MEAKTFPKGYSIMESAVAVATISLIVLITTVSLRTATVNEDALAKVSLLTISGVQDRSQQINGVYISAQEIMSSSTPLNSVTAVDSQSTTYDQVSVTVTSDGVTLAAKAKKDCWLLRIVDQPTATRLAQTWFLVQDYAGNNDAGCSASLALPETITNTDNDSDTPHILQGN